MKRLLLSAGLLVVCVLSNTTLAHPCRTRLLELGAPSRLVFGPGSLGSVPETCPSTETGVQAFGSALVAVQDFYGYVNGGLGANLRYAFSDRDWMSLQFVPFEYRFSANATIEASKSGMGAGALGYHRQFTLSRTLLISPYVRVLIPTESVYENSVRYGFDHGISLAALLTKRLVLTGGFSYPSYFVVNGTRFFAYSIPNVSVDSVLMINPWLSVLLGAGARFRTGQQTAFESFDPRFAIRSCLLGGLRMELGAATPLGGADRTDVVGVLDVAWVF